MWTQRTTNKKRRKTGRKKQNRQKAVLNRKQGYGSGNLVKTSRGRHKNPGKRMDGCNNSQKWQRTFLWCFFKGVSSLSSSIRFFSFGLPDWFGCPLFNHSITTEQVSRILFSLQVTTAVELSSTPQHASSRLPICCMRAVLTRCSSWVRQSPNDSCWRAEWKVEATSTKSAAWGLSHRKSLWGKVQSWD